MVSRSADTNQSELAVAAISPPVSDTLHLGLSVPAVIAADTAPLIATAMACGTRYFLAHERGGEAALGAHEAMPLQVSIRIPPRLLRDWTTAAKLDTSIEDAFTTSLGRLRQDRIEACRLDGSLPPSALNRACTVLEQFIDDRVLGHLSIAIPQLTGTADEDWRPLLAAHPAITEFTFRPARQEFGSLGSRRLAARRYGMKLVERWSLRHFGGLLDAAPGDLRQEARRYGLSLSLLPLVVGVYVPEVSMICVEDVTPDGYAEACRVVREVNPDSHLMRSVCAEFFG